MKYITTAVSVMLLMLVAVAAVGQPSMPKPAPELKQWDIWIGDWALSGTAKDTPTGPEYKLDWHMHNRWILDGFFIEFSHTSRGNGTESQLLEIGSYDPIKKIHTVSGFGNDGTTYVLTASFDKGTSVENFTIQSPDGGSSTCRNTWHFTADRMAVSGTQECEENGVRWTGFQVKGTKSKTAH